MKYFTPSEFQHSITATAHNIDNTIPADALQAITALVRHILDPLRDAWGRPITITSGYRCPRLNRIVGGAPASLHLTGCAADITTGDPTLNRHLYQLIQDLHLPYFELIGKKYNFRWIHISYNPHRPQRNPA